QVCPTCGGSGNVVTRNTIIEDLDAWLSKFKYNTDYRAVDIYINPYLKSHLEKGLLSIKRKWMLHYFVKVTLVGDDTVSLNEYKITLAGSDVEITDAVMRGEDLDQLINQEDSHEQQRTKRSSQGANLDFYKKNNKKDTRKPRPSRNKNKKRSKYYKN